MTRARHEVLAVMLRCALGLLLPDVAAAQGADGQPRIVVGISAGGQLSSTDFSESITFEQFAESGTFEAGYEIGTGPLIEANLSIRLIGPIGAGVSVSGFRSNNLVTVEAEFPHPFFFNRHRAFAGEVAEAERREAALHLQAALLVPAGDLHLTFSGGPSIFRVHQELSARIEFDEVFPFDVIVDPEAVAVTERETAVGFNIGADATWRIGDRWGLGGLVRYSRATIDFSLPDALRSDRSISIDAGGLHAAAGLRLFF